MIKLYTFYHNKPEDNSEIILFKESAKMSLADIIESFGLKWPPDQLLMKVGKRRWYEFKDYN